MANCAILQKVTESTTAGPFLATITRNHLPIFKILSNFVHFCTIFCTFFAQIFKCFDLFYHFLTFSCLFFYHFSEILHTCPGILK